MLADGFEEAEALVPWDLIKRSGADIELVSVNAGKNVTGAHGLAVTADKTIDELDGVLPDCIVLPGGMPGMTNLLACGKLCKMIAAANAERKIIAAICASPSILGELGVLQGKKAVCFPGFESRLHGAVITADHVCSDGNIITAKGMGVSFEFAFAVIERLFGSEKVSALKNGVQYKQVI